MVVDIHEVYANDSRSGAENHRRFLGEESFDNEFEFVRWDGMKL